MRLFMLYYKAREHEYVQEYTARVYLHKGIEYITRHTAMLAGDGSCLSDWLTIADITNDNKPKIEKTGAEIAADVIKRAGLRWED